MTTKITPEPDDPTTLSKTQVIVFTTIGVISSLALAATSTGWF